MLVTEEEAKEMWCKPNSLIATLAIIAGQMGAKIKLEAGTGHCDASKCMHWRLDEPAIHDAETGEEKHPALGFCGLAGKP